MDHLAFYILAAAVTIMILYVMISLSYIKRRKQAFLSMQDNLCVGAEVLVGNAIYGRISGLESDRVRVRIADQVTITADRAAVFRTPPPGQGAKIQESRHD